MAYRCNLCVNFIAITLALLLNHLGRCHSNDPNFHALCGINGCTRTYREFFSFRNHVSTKHADLLRAERDLEAADQTNNSLGESDMDFDTNEDESATLYDVTSSPPDDLVRESEEIRRNGALYLLKMKDRDRASQTAIDSFVENTTSIVRKSMEILKSGLINRLDTAGIDFRAVPGLTELFKEDSLAMNPFSGLNGEKQQNEYFKDHLNLVVSSAT